MVSHSKRVLVTGFTLAIRWHGYLLMQVIRTLYIGTYFLLEETNWRGTLAYDTVRELEPNGQIYVSKKGKTWRSIQRPCLL
jgi:hypothetical protein